MLLDRVDPSLHVCELSFELLELIAAVAARVIYVLLRMPNVRSKDTAR
jgi:hypothetical protein